MQNKLTVISYTIFYEKKLYVYIPVGYIELLGGQTSIEKMFADVSVGLGMPNSRLTTEYLVLVLETSGLAHAKKLATEFDSCVVGALIETGNYVLVSGELKHKNVHDAQKKLEEQEYAQAKGQSALFFLLLIFAIFFVALAGVFYIAAAATR